MAKTNHSPGGFRWLTGSPIPYEKSKPIEISTKTKYNLQRVNPVQRVISDHFVTLEEKDEISSRSAISSITTPPELSHFAYGSVKSFSPVLQKARQSPTKEIRLRSKSMENVPEIGTHAVWSKVPKGRHSEMSGTFIEFYKSTYPNSFIGQQKGIGCVIPVKLNVSAIASHKWWSQSSRRRFQSYHFESRDLDTPYTLIKIQDKPLSSLLNHMKGTESILRQDNGFRSKLRPLKEYLKKSYKKSQIGQKLTTRKPVTQNFSRRPKSTKMRTSKNLVPRSSIRIESSLDNHAGY